MASTPLRRRLFANCSRSGRWAHSRARPGPARLISSRPWRTTLSPHGLARNILLASQSHEAVNNAAEAVLKLFAGDDGAPSILRVGNESVVSDRLMPFHTDQLEQLYKDRFRAETRERLQAAGKTLGLPDVVLEATIFVETTLRPVAERLVELQTATDPDPARVASLQATLETQIAQMELAGGAFALDLSDPLAVLDTRALGGFCSGAHPCTARPRTCRPHARLSSGRTRLRRQRLNGTHADSRLSWLGRVRSWRVPA